MKLANELRREWSC